MTNYIQLLAAAMLIGMTACASVEAERPAPVTVAEIIAMSKANVPAADIIVKIQSSGTVYPLRASQLGVLEEDGVDPVVIDFMQLTYLDAVRRDERYLNNLEFQNELNYQQYLNNRRNQNRIIFENQGYYHAPYSWDDGYFNRYWRR